MKKQILTATALVTGLIIGASAISAFAAGTWTAPCANPPACNTDAPINVGSLIQEKIGGLWIHGGVAIDGNLVVATSSPTWGKVLMSTDNNGTAKWVATSTLGISGGGGGGGYPAISCASDSVMQGIATDGTPVCVPVTINTPSPFDFSVSSPNVSVVAGNSFTIPVTFGLVSGASKTIAWNLSSAPGWVTGNWSPTSCLPTCTSTFVSGVVPSGTAAGTYTALINATDGSITRTGTATINVTAAYVAPSCNYASIPAASNRSVDAYTKVSLVSGSPSVNMCEQSGGCSVVVTRDHGNTGNTVSFDFVQAAGTHTWTENIPGNNLRTGTNGNNIIENIFGGGTMNNTDLDDDNSASGDTSSSYLSLRGGQGFNGSWEISVCP